MSIFLEIAQLDNGDVVLREAEDDDEASVPPAPANGVEPTRDPLVRIRFSAEVKDMLGHQLVGVAEAMIDAATDYLEGENGEIRLESDPTANQVVH